MNTPRDDPPTAATPAKPQTRAELLKQLRLAEWNEDSLLGHLHRKYDQKGLLSLRRLRAQMEELRSQLEAPADS